MNELSQLAEILLNALKECNRVTETKLPPVIAGEMIGVRHQIQDVLDQVSYNSRLLEQPNRYK